MNIDKVMEQLEEGQNTPQTMICRVVIPEKAINNYGLRRPRRAKGEPEPATPPESYLVWCLTIGNDQANRTSFYGHKLKDAVNRALEYKNPGSTAPAPANG